MAESGSVRTDLGVLTTIDAQPRHERRTAAAARESVGSRRKRRRWLLAIGGAAGVVLVALLVLARAVQPPEVTTVRVRRADVIQTLVTSGRVAAPTEASLGSTFAATIVAVPVEEGDRVEEGAILLRLDDAEARAAVAQAEAAVASARARVRQVSRLGTVLAREELSRARAAAEEAERDLERTERLVRAGALPSTSLASARLERDTAQSRAETAAARSSDTAPSGTEPRIAAAQLSEAEAALDAARARLDRTVLRAPASGVVEERRADPGTLAQPGQILITFMADGAVELVTEPDESNLSLLAVGQPALASTEAFPEQTFDAVVRRIAPSVDPDRGTVEVRLEVPDPPAYLRPDMTVSVDIVVGRSSNALTVPENAVYDRASANPWVLRVEDGRAVRRDVVLGLRGDRTVEIRTGLDEGDLVVTGSDAVQPGERVRVSEREG